MATSTNDKPTNRFKPEEAEWPTAEHKEQGRLELAGLQFPRLEQMLASIHPVEAKDLACQVTVFACFTGAARC